MFVERRRVDRDRRLGGRIPVVFAVRQRLGGRMQLGQAEDIGPLGITLRRHRDFPVVPQTPVSLSFELPGMRGIIEAEGRVVSDRRMGFFRRTGVRFDGVSHEHLAMLSAFCRARRTA
jgi:hypothetical protein